MAIAKQKADDEHEHDHDHEKDRKFVSLNDEVSNSLTSVVDVSVDVVVHVDLLVHVHVLVDVAGCFAAPLRRPIPSS